MLYLNKRGQAKFLVTIMIVIIGFIVVFAVVRMFASKAEGTQLEMQCRASVLAKAKSLVNVEVGVVKVNVHVAPLLCFTQEKTIKGNEEEVMEQLAELMLRCKWMFADGRYNNVLGGESGDQCFPCYTVKIDSDVDIAAWEFNEFLRTKKKKDKLLWNLLQEPVGMRVLIPKEIKGKHIYQVMYSDFSKGRWYVPVLEGEDKKLNGIYLVDPNDMPKTWYRFYQKIFWGEGAYEPCKIWG